MRRRKPKGPKKVAYRIIAADSGAGTLLYKMLHALVNEHHRELAPANIVLAWHAGWKLDVDGRAKLGQAKKCSDLDRELRDYDLIVILNRMFFENPSTTHEQQRAILDHELTHFARKQDTNGEDLEDERGRPVFRLRRHDLEEFSMVVERNGLYKRDIEHFAQALARGSQQTLPGISDEPEAARKVPFRGGDRPKKPNGRAAAGGVQ